MENIFNALTTVSRNLSIFITVFLVIAVLFGSLALVALLLMKFGWVIKMTLLTVAMIVLKPLRWVVNGLYDIVSVSGKRNVAKHSAKKEEY